MKLHMRDLTIHDNNTDPGEEKERHDEMGSKSSSDNDRKRKLTKKKKMKKKKKGEKKTRKLKQRKMLVHGKYI